MRKITLFTLLLSLIIGYSFAQSGWFWLNPLPTGNDLNTVTFINSQKVITAGSNGTILESSISNNLGNNWIFRGSILSKDHSVKDVKFIDEQNGIITGTIEISNTGFILYTSNAGLTWVNTFNSSEKLFRLFVLDSTIVFAAGDENFLKSTNKGLGWTTIQLPTSMLVRGINFINSNIGYLVGYKYIQAPPPIIYYTQSIFLKTTNGGSSWMIDSLGNGFQLSDIYFVNPNTGYILTNTNGLLKSTNAGINWLNLNLSGSYLNSMYCIDVNRIFLSSNTGKIIKTTNSGINWTYYNISNLPINDIIVENSGTGYASGNKGNIFKTTNHGLNWMAITSGALPQFSSDIFYGIYFVDNSTGTVVGSSANGCIYRTTDGGLSWVMQGDVNCFNGYKRDVFFTNALTGIIVGDGMQKTTNGGNNWYYVDVVTPGLQKVLFINEQTGFSLGGPRILSTTNMGSNWSVKFQSWGMFLHDIDFYGNKAFAVGESTIVLSSSDQGESWNIKNTGLGGNYLLNAIQLLNDSTLIISEKNGKLFKSTNSGNNWRIVFSDSTLTINNMCFGDALTGIVACNKGLILKTTNSGENWVKVQTNCLSNLLKCSKKGDNNFAVAGEYLTILSTSEPGIIGIHSINYNVPQIFTLSQNYPNPFNPVTKIKFDVPKTSFTKIIIYDILGREVATLVNEELKPGTYEADWNAAGFSSGVYFYKIIAGDYTETKKMVLMK